MAIHDLETEKSDLISIFRKCEVNKMIVMIIIRDGNGYSNSEIMKNNSNGIHNSNNDDNDYMNTNIAHENKKIITIRKITGMNNNAKR